ncbi:MAG: diaminopimelate decarboxylase [Candidatus Woesearchaeota archaeon]
MVLQKEKLQKYAKKYGTPLYVYDGDLIKQRYNELHKFITWPKLKIFYAMKANYNVHILNLLKEQGANIDAVSPGDVLLATKLGFKKEQILYTANHLTEDEMHLVAKQGILMNLGSLSRLEKYGKSYPGTKICLRFNTDVVAGEFWKIKTGGELTKFGILMQDVNKVKEIIVKYNLTVVGLHVHTGSGIASTVDFIQSMKNLMNVGSKNNFPDLEFMDFGGGFKIPYEPDEKRIDYQKFGEEITKVFSDYCKEYGKELEMYFEPGKYLVGEAGHLLITVNTLKDNRGRLIAGTDSGFPQLIRPMFYGAYHIIENLSNPDGEKKKYDICGNICETGDCFATEREMPEINEGDLLDIRNAGAYCYAMGGVYNIRPMPSEIIIVDDNDMLSRKALTFDELTEQILSESKINN